MCGHVVIKLPPPSPTCVCGHVVIKLLPPPSPPPVSALGTLIESSKCSILNSGVLKTPRAKDPHVQICVCGGGVKSQGSGKGHP